MVLVVPKAVLADVVSLSPTKDNTLFESASGSLSNGAGPNFFVGRTSTLTGGVLRRGVIAFAIAGNIPAGSTINSATLTLNMSRTSISAGPRIISLRRLLKDWGEGFSLSLGGGGAAAATGDATWRHTFFNTVFWSTAGGDFSGSTSASRSVDGIGFYTWGSTAAMVADVQDWLDNPGSNFGWILIGDESTITTAKRFDTKEISLSGNRPNLTIEFTSPSPSAGEVPNGDDVPGIPLTVEEAAGGFITLSWGVSCLAGDTDFEIYEGTIGDFTSHMSRFCSTGGATSVTFIPSGGSTYYLVVPRNSTVEGSYGRDSDGVERPQGSVFCLTQVLGTCP